MSRSGFSKVAAFKAAALALLVVGYANLTNPLLIRAYGMVPVKAMCTLAANPCQSCAVNGQTQCLPPVSTYSWGACGVFQNSECYNTNYSCNQSKMYDCASPPAYQHQLCNMAGAGLHSCSYTP